MQVQVQASETHISGHGPASEGRSNGELAFPREKVSRERQEIAAKRQESVKKSMVKRIVNHKYGSVSGC